MNELAAICDSPDRAQCVHACLKGLFDIQCISPNGLNETQPPGQYTVVLIDLNDPDRVRSVRRWLSRKPRDAKVIFVTERGSRLELVRACAIGATDIVTQPVDAVKLITKLYGDFKSLAHDGAEFRGEAGPGVVAALEAVQSAFALAWLGSPLNQTAIDKATDSIATAVRADGLARWIETVRKHHSQTYQHSLVVTGLAVGFGLQLGLSRIDLKRLSFSGIMHDIGKARVPVSILEKPGPLDEKEMTLIKQHPVFGWEALQDVSAIPAEIRDAVLHHHEYLDGTGYPDGLQGSEISDLVRILTIVDIFGALIERRSYKPPFSGESAYQVLLDMGTKLDRDLVREFRAVSQTEIGD